MFTIAQDAARSVIVPLDAVAKSARTKIEQMNGIL